MSDEPTRSEDENIPPPATWAGRERGEGEADDAGDDAADQAPADDATGLTEDFDQVEKELMAQWEAGPEGDAADEPDEPEEAEQPEEPEEPDEADEPEADPADELAEPPDEFSFEPAEDEAEEEPAAPVVPSHEAGEHTVEADPAALGDKVAAREAALAGVRARAAAQAAKRAAVTATNATPAAAAGAQPASAVAPVAAPGPAVVGAAHGEHEQESEAVAAAIEASLGAAGDPPKRGMLWRFSATFFVVIASIATATALSLLLYLTDLTKALNKNGGLGGGVEQLLPPAGEGDPQTIMILGSDTRVKDLKSLKKARAAGEDVGRSDTTMLLHIDPPNHAISVLSLPRDLKVNIPGVGVDKLNAAYSYGGPKKTLQTVTALLGTPGHPFEVNHIVNVDFDGFEEAVDAIGCVYIDVDRHYYHSNAGLDPSAYYAEIDIPAGYRKLCGFEALNYARFRHDDNDLVRGARQQDFVREARQRIPPEKLFSDRKDLLGIFTKYTTTDIHEGTVLLGLLKTLISARGAKVHQVKFQGDIGGPDDPYVTASNNQIRDAVAEFMGEPAPAPASNAPPPDLAAAKVKAKGAAKAKTKTKPAAVKKPPKPKPENAELVDSEENGLSYAQRVQKERRLKFPVYYPRRITPSSTFAEDTRAFPIEAPSKGDKPHVGYKIVLEFSGAGFTEYWGMSGTDWKDPPILDHPSGSEEINGKPYKLFYDGSKLRLVSWKTDDGSYWVSNTLLETLSEDQMLAIASTAGVLHAPKPKPKGKRRR